jgi:putative transposase
VLEIAPSTYYNAKARRPSARAERDAELRPKLRALWQRNYSVYGRRKLTKAARKAGLDVGRDQVARLMRAEGIRGASRSKRRFTTHSDPAALRAPDLLRRDFTATRPNHKWVADFTYCSTWSGVVYVAFVIDVFSRRIVGWKASRSMTAALVVDALNMAAWVRRGVELDGLICHSDAGGRPLPPANTRTSAARRVDTSTTRSPAATSRCARCLPTPLQPSTAQVRGRHWRPNERSSRKPSALFGNCRRARTLPLTLITTTALSRLCGSTPITTLVTASSPCSSYQDAGRAALLRAWQTPLEPLPTGRCPTGSDPFASHTPNQGGQPDPEPTRQTPQLKAGRPRTWPPFKQVARFGRASPVGTTPQNDRREIRQIWRG